MPSINVNTNASIEEDKNDTEVDIEIKPPTLTDHLNKKLLNSFLTRLNAGDSNLNQMFNDISNDILNGDIDEIDDDLHVINENNDSGGEVEDTNDANEDEVKKDENDEDVPAKKVRKQSQRPILNAERLKGPRGLICMEKHYSKLKFRGHGYEQEDLNTIMTSLQHWCHRLYPKYKFDDTLEQLEKLGVKKPVITLRKKIIMNMLDDEIFGDAQQDVDEPEHATQDIPPAKTLDPFDLLFDEDRHHLKTNEHSLELELTDEQQELIERNRILAAERRRIRLQAQESREIENLTSLSNQENNVSSEITMS